MRMTALQRISLAMERASGELSDEDASEHAWRFRGAADAIFARGLPSTEGERLHAKGLDESGDFADDYTEGWSLGRALSR